MVGSLSYIGGRLTAPVSGEEETDKELADKAKAKTKSAADAVSSGVRTAKVLNSLAGAKSFFCSIFKTSAM